MCCKAMCEFLYCHKFSTRAEDTKMLIGYARVSTEDQNLICSAMPSPRLVASEFSRTRLRAHAMTARALQRPCRICGKVTAW
jgi:hypothetical protein